ncbi:endodeoxyribonuclease [Lobosporangium transversale]|nr:endodeoxyribonuclease [Lobosporangium transversale]
MEYSNHLSSDLHSEDYELMDSLIDKGSSWTGLQTMSSTMIYPEQHQVEGSEDSIDTEAIIQQLYYDELLHLQSEDCEREDDRMSFEEEQQSLSSWTFNHSADLPISGEINSWDDFIHNDQPLWSWSNCFSELDQTEYYDQWKKEDLEDPETSEPSEFSSFSFSFKSEEDSSESDEYSTILSSDWLEPEAHPYGVLDQKDQCMSPRIDAKNYIQGLSSQGPYVNTTCRSQEWVLEKLESFASRFLNDLSLERQPSIELANRTSMRAIIYDEESGVIRRRLSPNERRMDIDGKLSDEASVRSRGAIIYDNDGIDDGNISRSSIIGKGHTLNESEQKQLLASPSSRSFTIIHRFGTTRVVPSAMRVVDLMHENICRGAISSKRDLYYRDVGLFRSQLAVDNIVEDVACTLEVPRSCLNVVAGGRSIAFGSIRLTTKIRGKRMDQHQHDQQQQEATVNYSNHKADLNSEIEVTELMADTAPHDMMRQGAEITSNDECKESDDPLNKSFAQTSYNTLITLPATMDEILKVEIHPRTRFILVIEKEATMEYLLSLGFCETHGPCILLTSKGYPDRAVRQLLKLLSFMTESGRYKVERQSGSNWGDSLSHFILPVIDPSGFSDSTSSANQSFGHSLDIPLLALVDCDPYGIEIYLTYRCGSVRSAYDNANLAVTSLKCLGHIPDDWQRGFLGSYGFNQSITNSSCKEGQISSSDNHQRVEAETETEIECEHEHECQWSAFERYLIPLTHWDRLKLVKLLTQHPYILRHDGWKKQISRMLMMNRKAELQSLYIGLDCKPNELSTTMRQEEGAPNNSRSCDHLSKDSIGNGISNRLGTKDHPLVKYLEYKLQHHLWL